LYTQGNNSGGFIFPVFLARGEGEARLRVPKKQGKKPTLLPEVYILLIAPRENCEFVSRNQNISKNNLLKIEKLQYER
jgi:hypothetical protein